jgi:hypothetical protein
MKNMSTITNENGAVLILALFLIAALSLIGLAANRNIAIDTVIGSNHVESVQAFYIAEAGLEIGEQQAVFQLVFNDLKDFSTLLGTTLCDKKPSAGGGHYTVNLLNNTDEVNPGIDSDRIVTIRSLGTINGSKSTLASTIKVLTVPKVPGGITFVNDADVIASGTSYRISGYDYRLTDPVSSPTNTLPPRPAIALCQTNAGGDTVASIISALDQANLYGSNQVATTSDFNEKTLNEYIDSLKSRTNVSIDCNKLNLIYYNSQDHGGVGLAINCPKGNGIVIVDGDLEFLEYSNWQGVVIVRGGHLLLNGNNEIRGAVIIGGNPDTYIKGTKTGLEFEIGNNSAILYSSEAINNIANQAITDNGGKWTVLSWQRIH